MSNAFRLLIFTSRVLVTATLLSVFALGQRPADSATDDIFSSIQQNLTEAADRSLASALANQAWMSPTKSATNTGKRSSSSEETSILKVRAAVDRVNRLKPTLEPILRSEGVPVELTAVVLVESGGLPAALSPKGARGLWQFMPDTARHYDLVVDAAQDDRADVVKSTRAAGRYLRDLYAALGNWSLALAAYNAGELTVTNALRQVKSTNYKAISGSRLLPRETRNYVPAVMAAMHTLQYRVLGNLDGHLITGTRVAYALPGSGE